MNRMSATLLLLAALLPAGARSQTATLVRDINPQPPAGDASGSNPRQFAAADGRAVYITRESQESREGEPPTASYLLWATDGTAAGTSMLVRLCSPCGGGEPRKVAELPGLAIYSVPDASSGTAAWRTDGTRAGTFRLSPTFNSLSSYSTFLLGRRLLFQACGASACGLWSTDGSLAGTTLLSGPLPIDGLAVSGERAFFTTYAPQRETLWLTDGTVAGTQAIRPVGFPIYLTASGSRVFFLAGGDDYPTDLWTSDGTARGTRFLRSFAQPNHYQGAYTNYLKAVPGGVVLVGVSGGSSGINLWKSDGTAEGTRQLTSFSDLASVGGLAESQIATAGDRLFFIPSGIAGPRLWSSRGTAATTAPVTGCPGGCPALLPLSPLLPAGDRVVFAAQDPAHGAEPWASDGTGAGTRILRDLCAGACDSNPETFTPHGGTLDFRATWNGRTRLVRTDGITALPLAPVAGDPPPAPAGGPTFPIDLADVGSRTFFAGFDSQGSQPWVTDGTAAGSRRIVSGPRSGGSDPRDSVVLGGRLLFTASDGIERSVWTLDAQGNAAPIAATAVAVALPGPSTLTVSGSFAYFLSDRGADGMELWRTDGSPAGTQRLAAFQNRVLSDLRDLGGSLAFRVTTTDGEQPVFSFWGSDGTPEGTTARFGLPPDTEQISFVTALGPELYFFLDGETASYVFRSDGTAAGTRSLLQQSALACVDSEAETQFLRSAGRVYFTSCQSDGLFLYQTDGTAAGTARVIPAPGDDTATNSPNPQAPFEFQGDLYYFGYNPDFNSPVNLILWRGRTAATAAPLKAVGYSFYEPVLPEFTVLGDRLYFRAWDPEHGFELWRTDGTTAGTARVRDVALGPTSSDPQGLVVAGGRLWFSALDPDHGRELWTSDGTRQGTHLVEDLAPGPLSSAPEQLTPFAGRLCFTADDGATGREPWCLPLGSP
jgi:ELWxxDGT repeat protein